MKKVFGLLVVLVTLSFGSCTTVDSGHAGVEVSWGGETNMNTVYNEGMATGFSWVWNDMIEYDVREKTLVTWSARQLLELRLKVWKFEQMGLALLRSEQGLSKAKTHVRTKTLVTWSAR